LLKFISLSPFYFGLLAYLQLRCRGEKKRCKP
jgi:hypothetical protein